MDNELSLIVAMSKNGCIGKDNSLPWGKQKNDMTFFKNTTTGSTVIMGRNTFNSMRDKALPKRENIVLSRGMKKSEGVTIVDSIEKALTTANKLEKPIYVIGGKTIYEPFIDKVNVMYITVIDVIINGDTFFPHFNKREWFQEVVEVGESDEKNENGYTIYKFIRK